MISVIRTRIDPTDYDSVVKKILLWAKEKNSRYICVANVHTLMEANDSADFQSIVNQADLVTPDGVPVVWMLRLKGHSLQERVYGPTLMLKTLEVASITGMPVGFYGGTPEILDQLIKRMLIRFPNLKVGYSFSPPYRDLSPEEDAVICNEILNSKIRILLVGLGCPKQERWMSEHHGKIPAVMIGVGAAFDFHSGLKPQAPGWMQRIGMEWFFRLLSEPRRLWWRYLYHNPRFIFLAIYDLLGFYG